MLNTKLNQTKANQTEPNETRAKVCNSYLNSIHTASSVILNPNRLPARARSGIKSEKELNSENFIKMYTYLHTLRILLQDLGGPNWNAVKETM